VTEGADTDMRVPKNRFKEALRTGRQQIGLWCSLVSSYCAEVVAGSGFDWLLFDTEHSPSGVEDVLLQLQAVAPYDVSPVVRPSCSDTVLIKRYLDIGAQTLLIPYVESAQEAIKVVAAMRYAPAGVRGVSALTRATCFGRVEGYAKRAAEELCLLVQVETQKSLDELEEITNVDGVDGVFIGPADLAASLGYPGEPNHGVVRRAIEDAIRRIHICGKPVGLLTGDTTFAKRAIELGTSFTAIGVDVGILARGTESLVAQFRGKD
jgi:4-hydroxy-2-oxoheptanedioate aldolase